MAQELLNENVQEIVITPFLKLELLPTGHANWGLVTNNNFIRVENASQSCVEQVTVLRDSMTTWSSGFEDELRTVQSMVEAETIERVNAIDNLQAQILRARFSGRAMIAGTPSTFIHNLNMFPQVTVIKENSGLDVTNAFDTVIVHTNVNQISLTVGVNGTYTVVCVA